LHDFVAWREALTSVDDIGAWRPIRRNLSVANRPTEPVRVAEITAAGFRLAGVPPLLGRHLVEADEREGAAPVLVIGHDAWQRHFAGDPNVVGRVVHLGETTFTVAGVMPEGFGFPVNDQYWTPLRVNSLVYGRRAGPVVFVFGRLAAGADLDAARAEVTALGERAAAEFPDTHARLRPRVVPYTTSFFDDMEGWEIPAVQVLVVLLLVVVCANVAALVYARMATRRVEIAVRSALGASRGRIVGQMFVEGLVLSAAAAALGLGIVRFTARQVDALVERLGGMPFWMDVGLISASVGWYVLALTVLGAVIVGAVPALQATGRRAQAGLQQTAASLSGWKLGRTYTALIVAQVALAVAILPAAAASAWMAIAYSLAEPGFPAQEFLTARIVMDRDATAGTDAEAYDRAFGVRLLDRQTELVRRLESESGVSEAIFLTAVPGLEPLARIDVEGGAGGDAGIGRVPPGFFQVFGVSILAGRQFDTRDLGPGVAAVLHDADGDGMVDSASLPRAPAGRSVIVNRTFAEQMLGGSGAIGRRVREAGVRGAPPGPWFEIVGVASDVPAAPQEPRAVQARLYVPVSPGQAYSELLAVRVHTGEPTALAGRLREIAAALDRRLQVLDVRPLADRLRQAQTELRLVAWSTGLVTVSVLLLSAAGLYALMSVTVARRRREIGVRIALGADRRRVLGSIFSRVLLQLATGIVAGVALAVALDALTDGELTGGVGPAMLPAVAAFMLVVGLVAVVGPARRALRIQPVDALREDQ
jgi:predicted permease